jgi:hypothetical protein
MADFFTTVTILKNMKRTTTLTLLLLIYHASLIAAEGLVRDADSLPIQVKQCSAPAVADYNSDGLKDLVVGQQGEGWPQMGFIEYYRN